MISVEEAIQSVLRDLNPLGLEEVNLLQATNSICGEEIKARRDIPPCNVSMMDGFAVRSDDLEGAERNRSVVLKIIEKLPAGYVSRRRIKRGETIKIMTGAPIPSGSDAVIAIEETHIKGDKVYVYNRIKRGRNIRIQGEILRVGDTIVKKGMPLTPFIIEALASSGYSSINVYKTPRVAILSTGDELIYVDEEPSPGKTVNSNSYALTAMVKESGAIPVPLGIVRDSRNDLKKGLEKAISEDLVIITGGTSMGEYDFVSEVLRGMGGDIKFERVAMRPGQSTIFGTIHEKPIFGLPGNPTSSMISFEVFVRPCILKMAGFSRIFKPVIEALIERDLINKSGKKFFHQGLLIEDNGTNRVIPIKDKWVGNNRNLISPNCLIIIPEDTNKIKAGEMVKIMIIDPNFDLKKGFYI